MPRAASHEYSKTLPSSDAGKVTRGTGEIQGSALERAQRARDREGEDQGLVPKKSPRPKARPEGLGDQKTSPRPKARPEGLKRMATGGMCRGMGAATKGGSYKKSG